MGAAGYSDRVFGLDQLNVARIERVFGQAPEVHGTARAAVVEVIVVHDRKETAGVIPDSGFRQNAVIVEVANPR